MEAGSSFHAYGSRRLVNHVPSIRCRSVLWLPNHGIFFLLILAVPLGSLVERQASSYMEALLGLGQIGIWQLVLVLAVLLLLFGARRVPGLARSMGSSLMEFKRGFREVDPRVPLRPPAGATNQTEEKAKAEDAT